MNMHEQDGIKKVYSGTIVEAEYIVELLDESGIGAMVRNMLDETIPLGYPEHAAFVFVAEQDFGQAAVLVEEYLKSVKEDNE